MGSGQSTRPPPFKRSISALQREWHARGYDLLEVVPAMVYAGSFLNQLKRIRAGRARRLWRRATRRVWLARALDARRLALVHEMQGPLVKYSPYAGFGYQAFGQRRQFILTVRGLCWMHETTAHASSAQAMSTMKGIPFTNMRRVATTGSRRRPGFLIEVYDPDWHHVHGEDMITYRFRGTHEDVEAWVSALAIMMMPWSLAPRHMRSHKLVSRPVEAAHAKRQSWIDPAMLVMRAQRSFSPTKLRIQ